MNRETEIELLKDQLRQSSERETSLLAQIEKTDQLYAQLDSHISVLESQVSELKAENIELRERLSRYERPEKDSHNSSIPPSKESIKAQAIRRTRSLRTPSGRPSGGQKGHKGTTRLINPTSDETQIHTPDYCTCCGKSLADIRGKEAEVRQSIDIPLPVCQAVIEPVEISSPIM